jgi:hypothetical protein
MTTAVEQVLVRAKIRRWRHVGSGWLVVKPHQLAVYRRKFISGLEEVQTFDIGQLAGVEREAAAKGLRLMFNGTNGESAVEAFSFAGEKYAEKVNTILVGLLKEAEERNRQQQEEAARLEKEQLERRKQTREAFAAEVWEISEILWLFARADYFMVYAVITADWSEARKQYSTVWQQADRLKKFASIEITVALHELDQSVTSQDGQEVIRKASQLLKHLSDQIVQNGAVWARWQDEKEMLSAVLPNCNYLPYFLLFGAGYFEALLAARIEDWTGVNSALSLLRSSGAILRSCFAIDLDNLLDKANAAAAERNVPLFAETAGKIESAALAAFKARLFKFEPPAEKPEGEKYALVSK